MKTLHVLVFISLISCAPKVTGEKVRVSQEILMNKVLDELNLDTSKIHLYASKKDPNISNETILILAEDEASDDDEEQRYTSHIVIVNAITGKIKYYFTEDSMSNGWVSDAIFIDDISIDLTNYQLNKSKNAFGVILKFRSMSQPNPYNQNSISLFTKKNGSLKKILDTYTIYEDSGIVNVNACYADFKTTENKLSMANTKANGYYDIFGYKHCEAKKLSYR